jgi:hypothetical protein
MSADDRYEARNDPTHGDVPSGDVKSSDYVTGGPIPVQKDDAPVEQGLNPATVDTDKQLGAFLLSSVPSPGFPPSALSPHRHPSTPFFCLVVR